MSERHACGNPPEKASYTLADAEKPSCGTDIVLHLKPVDLENGIEDYTDRWKFSMIVHKYSDFIAYPIIYEGPKQEPGETEDATKEIKIETKTLNSMKPIWTRSRSEVSESDYNDFYKHLSNDWTAPAAEGTALESGRNRGVRGAAVHPRTCAL